MEAQKLRTSKDIIKSEERIKKGKKTSESLTSLFNIRH